MEIELRAQLFALLLALCMGFIIGLGYDFLRPIRYRLKKIGGILLDALFCIAAGALMFAFAMGADSGRLGVWELAAAAAGFIAYINFLSPPVLRFLNVIWQFFEKILRAVKKILKKTAQQTKSVFKKVKKSIIIKK